MMGLQLAPLHISSLTTTTATTDLRFLRELVKIMGTGVERQWTLMTFLQVYTYAFIHTCFVYV